MTKETLELKIRKLRTELSFHISAKAHGGPDFDVEIAELRKQIYELENERESS